MIEGENCFDWELVNGTTQRLEMLCEVHQTEVDWFEGEDMSMASGWQREKRFAPGWNGTGFVMDNYGSEPLFLRVETEPSSPRSYIWVRYYKRQGDETPVYLTINNSSLPFANIKSEDLNIWRWEKIGPVTLNDDSKLFISHPYNGDPLNFMAIFIDSLTITTDAEFSPNINPWEPMHPIVFSFEQPQSSGTVQLDIPSGLYRCKAIVESDLPVVNMLGSISSSLVSESIEIESK